MLFRPICSVISLTQFIFWCHSVKCDFSQAISLVIIEFRSVFVGVVVHCIQAFLCSRVWFVLRRAIFYSAFHLMCFQDLQISTNLVIVHLDVDELRLKDAYMCDCFGMNMNTLQCIYAVFSLSFTTVSQTGGKFQR